MSKGYILIKYTKYGLFAILAFIFQQTHAQTYVLDTLGGESLQPIVQQQLNQLPNGGQVMVYQQRLIINTTPENYQTIKTFVQKIDQLPKNLTIMVRVSNHENSQQSANFGQIGVFNKQIFINGQWQQQHHQTLGQQLFQINTLSGKPARLYLSQMMPVTLRQYWKNHRPQIWLGQTLLTAEQGIQVLPTLLTNGQISLQIGQENTKFGQYQEQMMVSGQSLTNHMVLSPNQWTKIGFIDLQQNQLTNHGNYDIKQHLPIEVKVSY